MSIVIVCHGGAYAVPNTIADAAVAGVTRAADTGMRMMISKLIAASGSTSAASDTTSTVKSTASTEAVVAALCVLEDDPAFDAGIGSCLTAEGKVEMDAVVAVSHRDKGVSTGAVACINNVRHPVLVAQHVMENTRHCLLVGSGATEYARRTQASASATDEELTTETMRMELEELRSYGTVVDRVFNKPNDAGAAGGNGRDGCDHDTVGAVAFDGATVSGATSTGGISCKLPGRVGDSPCFGSGVFADFSAADISQRGDDNTDDIIMAACSTTGHGESIIAATLASRVVNGISSDRGPAAAASSALAYMKKRTHGGCGGAIVCDSLGRIGAVWTTPRMPWAVCRVTLAEVPRLLEAAAGDVGKIALDVKSGIEIESMKEAAQC